MAQTIWHPPQKKENRHYYCCNLLYSITTYDDIHLRYRDTASYVYICVYIYCKYSIAINPTIFLLHPYLD
jgi:hypothetical protein